jgi:hypothetical protein
MLSNIAGFLGRCALSLLLALQVNVSVAQTATTSAAGAATNSSTNPDQAANALRNKYASLSSALSNNAFARPLSLDSVQTSNRVTGNAYAVLDAPFSLVSNVKNPRQLCDMIILHINTKYCRPTSDTSPSVLMVNFGKKTAQSIDDTFALEFAMATTTASAHFLQVSLNAEKGPLGTSNYGIELAAIPLPEW